MKNRTVWSGTNYLKSYSESRKLAEKIKEYYKPSPLYDKISVKVWQHPVTKFYHIESNISTFWPNVAELEERV
jgi:hypothetical protein